VTGRRRKLALCAVVGAAALAAPSASQAAITIGSDLGPAPANGLACVANPSCTWANTALPGQQVTSPIDGVVARWRIRVASTPGADLRLKVIRPAGGAHTGVNTSATQSLAASAIDQTHVFPTSQPIVTGDQIALDVDGDGEAGNLVIETAGPMMGVTELRWVPSLLDGETRTPTNTFTDNGELLVNADVEPDCDQDGLGDETQDSDTSSCNPPSVPPAQCDGKQPTIFGTTGNDVLRGTNKKDVIAALSGDDQVRGRNAKDMICGGEGNDFLKGGNGKDALHGEDGTDTCNGGRGKDKASSCEVTRKVP
jgi:RTX calcium-binding nonapeptide repeat (4 copies)